MEYQQSSTYLTLTVLQPISEEAWLSEAFVDEWTDGIIVKISKMDKLKFCDNWREICKAILNRITDHLYSNIDRVQAGFRPAANQRANC